MNKTEIRNIIDLCIEAYHQIHIDNKYEDYPLEGIPIKMTKQLFLIKYVYDFAFDGYKIFRMKDIKSVKRGAVEEYHDFIMHNEGFIKTDNAPTDIRLDSWKSFFEDAKVMDGIIDISTEEQVNIEKNFYVGRVIGVENNFLLFQEIDTCGKWMSGNSKISIFSIVEVSFESNYLKMLFKYQNCCISN